MKTTRIPSVVMIAMTTLLLSPMVSAGPPIEFDPGYPAPSSSFQETIAVGPAFTDLGTVWQWCATYAPVSYTGLYMEGCQQDTGVVTFKRVTTRVGTVMTEHFEIGFRGTMGSVACRLDTIGGGQGKAEGGILFLGRPYDCGTQSDVHVPHVDLPALCNPFVGILDARLLDGLFQSSRISMGSGGILAACA